MKKVLKFILNSLRSNILMKITALLFALILWNYVIAETNPVREKVLTNVPISYTNASQMESKWLTVSGSLDDILSEVTVTIDAGVQDHKLISTNNVKATVDLGTISSSGKVKLKIQPTTAYGTVTSVEPDTVELNVEDLVKRIIPIEAVTQGDPPTGYYIDTPVLDSTEVEISGARSDVNKVAKAVCYIPVEDVDSTIKESYRLTLLDSDNNVVSEEVLKGYVPSVVVELEVYKLKEVEINQDSLVTGKDSIATGYQIDSVLSSPAKVEIAAPDSVLETIDSLQVESVDITGANGDITKDAKIDLPDGAVYVSQKSVEVDAKISEIQKEVQFENVKISPKNLEQKLVATLSPDQTDVTINGGYAAVNAVKRSDIELYVDLTGLTAGTYKLPIVVPSMDGISSDEVTLTDEYATVTIE